MEFLRYQVSAFYPEDGLRSITSIVCTTACMIRGNRFIRNAKRKSKLGHCLRFVIAFRLTVTAHQEFLNLAAKIKAGSSFNLVAHAKRGSRRAIAAQACPKYNSDFLSRCTFLLIEAVHCI